MVTIPVNSLRSFCENVFIKAGASEEEAKIVVDTLIQANLRGYDSHGVLRIIEYCGNIKKGVFKTHVKPVEVKEDTSALVLDGKWGFGQVAVYRGMEKVIVKAKKNHVSVATVLNCNHCGSLGYYTSMASRENMIGFALANSVASVAPYGGRDRVMGTNAMSISIPSKKHRPFLLDFATSIVSGGTIELAQMKKETIPLGWLLNDEGRPTTNPNDYESLGEVKHGALLPFGTYKGSAICMAVEAIGGILAQGGIRKTTTNNGVFLMAMGIDFFRPVEEFEAEMDRLLDLVKGSKKAVGFEEVLYPGELEYRKEEQRLKEGIPIEDGTWNRMVALGRELGVEAPRVY